MADFQLCIDDADEHRWRMTADNYETIADSGEGYVRKADCEQARPPASAPRVARAGRLP